MEEFQRNKVFSSIPILEKQKCHNVTKSGVCVCVYVRVVCVGEGER